jgi:hypothetical protein
MARSRVAVGQIARIRLFFASWVSSARLNQSRNTTIVEVAADMYPLGKTWLWAAARRAV